MLGRPSESDTPMMVQWQKWKGFLILWWHRNDCQPKGRTSLWLRRMGRSPPSMCGDPPAWYPSNTLFHQITFLINVATHPFNTLTPTNLEARDLEVNGGVWRGETTDVGYDTFPSGWGILQYNEADHLNRFWSNWEIFKEADEQGEVRRDNGCGSDGGLWQPLLEGWIPLLRPGERYHHRFARVVVLVLISIIGKM